MTHSESNRKCRSFTRRGALVLAAISGATVLADLTPDWMSRLPVGAALTAGMQGLVVNEQGETFVTGITGSSSNTDIITAAYSPEGDLLWSHTWDGPAAWHDQSRGIALAPDGLVYVTGNTPGPGRYANVLVLKYDAVTGDLLDTIQYSSGPFLSEHGATIAADAQGDVYVGGGTVGDGADAMILKFDAAGAFQWKRVWDGPTFAPYSQDHARKLLIHPDGNPVVMIHGVMASQHPNYVVVKYAAADGAIVWETNWGVSGGDFPTDMELDAAGDVYVTGTGINFTNMYSTIKLLGSDGQLLWQAYDHAGLDDYATGLALDDRGGVYITGGVDPDGDRSNFNDNFYTVKRDAADGALQWTHSYGQNCIGCFDVPGDVLVDSAGHAFVVGQTSSPPYSSDMLLFSLDAQTGVELDRGVEHGAANETLSGGVLRFDERENLYIGGGTYHVNTGEKTMVVFKYPTLAGLAGDMNCDGFLDNEDIDPFVLALTQAEEYRLQWPACRLMNGDINGDGFVDNEDIDPFVALLTGP